MKPKPLGTRPMSGNVIPFRILSRDFVVNGELQHNKVIKIDQLLSNLVGKDVHELIVYCRGHNYKVGAAKLWDSMGLVDGTEDKLHVDETQHGGEWL